MNGQPIPEPSPIPLNAGDQCPGCGWVFATDDENEECNCPAF